MTPRSALLLIMSAALSFSLAGCMHASEVVVPWCNEEAPVHVDVWAESWQEVATWGTHGWINGTAVQDPNDLVNRIHVMADCPIAIQWGQVHHQNVLFKDRQGCTWKTNATLATRTCPSEAPA